MQHKRKKFIFVFALSPLKLSRGFHDWSYLFFREYNANISQDNSKAFSKRVFQLISNSIARVTINSFSGTIVNGVGLVIGEILGIGRDIVLSAST